MGSAAAAPRFWSTGSAVVVHKPSCPMACEIFPNQGLNPCLLHWQSDSLSLSHQGSPHSNFNQLAMLEKDGLFKINAKMWYWSPKMLLQQATSFSSSNESNVNNDFFFFFTVCLWQHHVKSFFGSGYDRTQPLSTPTQGHLQSLSGIRDLHWVTATWLKVKHIFQWIIGVREKCMPSTYYSGSEHLQGWSRRLSPGLISGGKEKGQDSYSKNSSPIIPPIGFTESTKFSFHKWILHRKGF